MRRLRGLFSRQPEQQVSRTVVVGLGNPGPRYAGTRHNVGEDVARALGRRLGATFTSHRSGSLVAETFTGPGGTPLALVVPSGFMNEVGGPVQRVLAFYKTALDRLVVVHDDIDLPVAALRLKRGGGAGGHNGLKDIARRCGGPDFLRVRVGVGRPPGRQDPASYVLQPFDRRQRDEIDVTVAEAGDAVLHLVERGLEAAQNTYHAAR